MPSSRLASLNSRFPIFFTRLPARLQSTEAVVILLDLELRQKFLAIYFATCNYCLYTSRSLLFILLGISETFLGTPPFPSTNNFFCSIRFACKRQRSSGPGAFLLKIHNQRAKTGLGMESIIGTACIFSFNSLCMGASSAQTAFDSHNSCLPSLLLSFRCSSDASGLPAFNSVWDQEDDDRSDDQYYIILQIDTIPFKPLDYTLAFRQQ